MLTPDFILFRKTTTRHQYNTRANKQIIMSKYEQENVATREALPQLQGQMGIILEHLQSQRDNATFVILIDITVVTIIVDTDLVVVDLVDIVVQLVIVSQPLF